MREVLVDVEQGQFAEHITVLHRCNVLLYPVFFHLDLRKYKPLDDDVHKISDIAFLKQNRLPLDLDQFGITVDELPDFFVLLSEII